MRFSFLAFEHVLFAMKSLTSFGLAVLQLCSKCRSSLATLFIVVGS